MTRGRIAWNVVTSYSNSAAKAMGLDAVVPTLERYAAAQEFMELIYQSVHRSTRITASSSDTFPLTISDYGRNHGRMGQQHGKLRQK